MSDPLLAIRNNHIAECGDPPIVDSDDADYTGYFQNAFGEQWVFTYNRSHEFGILRGGDIGWNEPQPVIDGSCGLVLDTPEKLWLKACQAAATCETVAMR
jgi:hypothetical protein